MSCTDNVINGRFLNYAWRDEKSGKCAFFFQTREMPVFTEIVRGQEVVTDPFSGEDETWYTFFCESQDKAMPFFYPLEPIQIQGRYNDIGSMGRCSGFILTYAEYHFQDRPASVYFLSSSLFNQISLNSARDIVNDLNDDLMSGALKPGASEAFAKAGHIARSTADAAVSFFKKHHAEHKFFHDLTDAGVNIPYDIYIKSINTYGVRAEEKILKDPYKCGEEIGISFHACDDIAKYSGIFCYDTFRAESLVHRTMERLSSYGHTWFPARQFFATAERLAKNDPEYPAPPAPLLMLKSDRSAVYQEYQGKECVFNADLVRAEQRSAENLMRLSAGRAVEEPFEQRYIDMVEEQEGITYNEQQKNAVKDILSRRGTAILTGGPGTGKTTLIRGIIAVYLMMHPDHRISLCAPTGRAAQRMEEAAGYKASTIHRLLEFQPFRTGGPLKSEQDPLDTDFVIVDESSMLDTEIFDYLLRAVPAKAKLLLVGDVDQLEPVGAGRIMADLLKTDDRLVQKCRLSEVYRQEKGSAIRQNAYNILRGNTKLVRQPDFQIISAKSDKSAVDECVSIVKQEYSMSEPFDVQVLCPTRIGGAGVYELNTQIQQAVNPRRNRPELTYGSSRFRVGDKVIMLHNHYGDPTYYNGDIGIIQDNTEHQLIVRVRGRDITLTRDLLGDVMLAYAVTIHKSQGSEFKNVIIVLPEECPYMLVNNLIYTAVTRGEECVSIIQVGNSLEKAITTPSAERNTTFLSEISKAESGSIIQTDLSLPTQPGRGALANSPTFWPWAH